MPAKVYFFAYPVHGGCKPLINNFQVHYNSIAAKILLKKAGIFVLNKTK